ncbi:succinyl-diaminopimelate desuccinylase [Coxiella endosymbiont of Amblyomma americanum]|uniref:succinyl-diaminopimelate desuccinylase n=1 Tax=Coxiella endosymbiont of Amblyomma americanum TaxID=325775 RepID=UPI00057EE7AE|nr:succinyl-diaminopimelate desuccinylase [Coxiella endosymbiont of Amblyomma americanum]AJC50329.1 succinyl-diaminopimelate desuccinylase [Coxiella endosymbiont of Amblyomma americanum]AUJ58676.1 succinyl-diaminopimelate desuccinylase [Coxiella-like endosymbiont of Amblyomma americanum]
MNKTLKLLKQLIACPSITPNDAGCQDILIRYLNASEFLCERLSFSKVNNLWAWHSSKRSGSSTPFFVFVGHTDVVPPGDAAQWKYPPFIPTEKNGYLYGRGATDMKSGLSAMVIAAKKFVKQYSNHNGTIGFIITSDEEGLANNGTYKVVEYLKKRNIKMNYCIVGEASSNKILGDAIKIGRRGSLHGYLTIFGKQGHIAYPHLADNPIHQCFQVFNALVNTAWDHGNSFFTPTSLQFYNIESNSRATNVIPERLEAKFNFRFAPIHSPKVLQKKFEGILNRHQIKYDVQWKIASQPFFNSKTKLVAIARRAIREICKCETELNTYGGTSDGRFLASTGCEVIELGPINKTAHLINENTLISDLNILSTVYFQILKSVLC